MNPSFVHRFRRKREAHSVADCERTYADLEREWLSACAEREQYRKAVEAVMKIGIAGKESGDEDQPFNRGWNTFRSRARTLIEHELGLPRSEEE